MKKMSSVIAVAMLLLSQGSATAENGVVEKEIMFGQTAATGGPASALGVGMREGILAAFKEANDAGGVNGRTLSMTTLDDGYEPGRAIENAKKLIHEDKVFALIGGVGTPTANAVEPITTMEKVPFIGPFTGAEFLRDDSKRYVVNMRGSYWEETEEWIERLTKDLGVKRIAILYQDDSYGRAGLSGVNRALEKRGMKLVGEGTYKRNTIAVKKAALMIRKSKPEAVVMVGAYKPCAEFIKVAKKLGMQSRFVNISFVGSKALASELGDAGDGVIVSQVVPFPFDASSSPLVAAYHKAIEAHNAKMEPGFVSLEGYMVGRFTVQVLQGIKGEVTRESFLDAVYNVGEFDLGGTTLKYSKGDNQGMDRVFLTVLDENGEFKAMETLQ